MTGDKLRKSDQAGDELMSTFQSTSPESVRYMYTKFPTGSPVHVCAGVRDVLPGGTCLCGGCLTWRHLLVCAMSVIETSGVPVAYTDGITIQFTLSSGTVKQKHTPLLSRHEAKSIS